MGVYKMNFCVIKNTTKVIDGSNNQVDIMLQNALNAGFLENDVEILTETEFETRKELEPKPTQPPSDMERIEALEGTLLMLLTEG